MKCKKEVIIFSAYRFIDGLIRYVLAKKDERCSYYPTETYENKICIILDKGLGDFILFSNYLKHLIQYYSTNSQVYIIADEYNVKFLNTYLPEGPFQTIILRKNELDTIDGNGLIDYYGQFHTAIIPMNAVTPRSVQIVRVLSPKIIYSLGNARFIRKYSILDYKVFKNIKTFELAEDFYCKMHNRFCKKLTGCECGYELLAPVSTEKIETEDYFLLNISASNYVKLLSIEKFLQLGVMIAKKTGYKPIVLGYLSEDNLKKINQSVFDCQYINCSDLPKTAALCKYAKLVITSDTGIYHLTLSIERGPKVYIPTWSYYNVLFEPYPSEMEESTRVKYIRMYSSCDRCPEKGLKCFYKKCLKKTVHCVEAMDPDFVYERVKVSEDRL